MMVRCGFGIGDRMLNFCRLDKPWNLFDKVIVNIIIYIIVGFPVFKLVTLVLG